MTAVVYYSYSGNTRKKAEEHARVIGADLIEITMDKPYAKAMTFVAGCPKAMARKGVPISFNGDLSKYDKFCIFMPIWADHPAPPFNSLLGKLPGGSVIDLYVCSAGGKTSSGAATKQFIESFSERGNIKVLRLNSYTDIKTGTKPAEG
jgi:flavodoxin